MEPADVATPLPIGGHDGRRADLRLRFGPGASDGPLSDDSVRAMLADAKCLLWQIVKLTATVLHSVNAGQLRKLVAAELDLPAGTIDEFGTMATGEPKAAPEGEPVNSGRDHRKGPRGRKHPLISLVQSGLQSIRLLAQIAGGTNPSAMNRESLEQKQEREALKQSEREFRALLNGKL